MRICSSPCQRIANSRNRYLNSVWLNTCTLEYYDQENSGNPALDFHFLLWLIYFHSYVDVRSHYYNKSRGVKDHLPFWNSRIFYGVSHLLFQNWAQQQDKKQMFKWTHRPSSHRCHAMTNNWVIFLPKKFHYHVWKMSWHHQVKLAKSPGEGFCVLCFAASVGRQIQKAQNNPQVVWVGVHPPLAQVPLGSCYHQCDTRTCIKSAWWLIWMRH